VISLYYVLYCTDMVLDQLVRLSDVLLLMKHWSVSGTSLANDHPTSAQVM